MYEISFYEDEKGNSDVKDLIEKLRDKSKKDKDARINYHKIVMSLFYSIILPRKQEKLQREKLRRPKGKLKIIREGGINYDYYMERI